MFLKQLPNDVHAILYASVKINNYKAAVEELIYNSLDADSTSIAIRIHVGESSIQVIDNGEGIKEIDMKLIGQRNLTSRFINLSALKSVPDKYGLRGESLSNIIEVSQVVSITSRCEDTEKTWMKTFNGGKTYKLTETTKRPSKGTTVSIKGFLYNLNIQRNAINELNELQEIKTFLEQVSLLHNNISLSLRDDSRNLIILQLHKKRDIYHTLSSVFNIEKSDFKELKVEKKQYKVKAFIGTTRKNISKYCVFLNRKLVHIDSQVYNIVNDSLKRNFKFRNKITKIKTHDNEFENCILDKYLPFYFMFIECPYIDYIMTNKSLEFKSWNQITMLLEKLIKFYIGNIPLKEVKTTNLKQNFNSRHQVKEIMKKILNNNPKKVEGLQMQNGVKGKISKRKRRKKNKEGKFSLLSTKKRTATTSIAGNEYTKSKIIRISPINILNSEENIIPNNDVICQTIDRKCDMLFPNKLKKTNICNAKMKEGIEIKNKIPAKLNSCNIKKRKITTNQKNLMFFRDNVFSKLVNPTDSIKKRCDAIEQKIQNILYSKNKNKKIAVKEIVKYDNTVKKVQNNVYRNVEESITNYNVHDSPNTKEICKHDKMNLKRHQDNATTFIPLKTTYDLIKTVMINENNFQPNINEFYENVQINSTNEENTRIVSRMTFESHKHDAHKIIKSTTLYHTNHQNIFTKNLYKEKHRKLNRSCNLNEPVSKIKSTRYKMPLNNIHTKLVDLAAVNSMISNVEEILYSTEFSKSTQKNNYKSNDNFVGTQNKSGSFYNTSSSINKFVTKMTNIQKKEHIAENSKENQSYKSKEFGYRQDDLITLLHHPDDDTNMEENVNKAINYRDLSNQTNFQFSKVQKFIIEPVKICETLLGSEDIFESEIARDLNLNSTHLDIVQDDNVNISHYFTTIDNYIKTGDVNKINNVTTGYDTQSLNIDKTEQITDLKQDNLNEYQLADKYCHKYEIATDFRYFSLQNRLRFVPKGMSPIFHNCNTKYARDYYHNEDYYENILYNNFINEVHINAEVFNPKLQNIKDLGTKVNEKLQTKIHKENAALKFNDKSLKAAIVLGQVDEKFIASVIENKYNQDKDTLKFLVLFDQHAVHERIRTEKNLSDYIKNNQWKSVKLEKNNMILSVDEVLYLHNYKDKFDELGLQFTILSPEEISINAVPEAILGKTRREVDIVMKAVRNLIAEEINVIRTQGGCISAHPKSIMDLVFSEACRYAIKFGDKLTKNDCIKLIKDLSDCKTPFQCAHGRPVMAVITDINREEEVYKINITKLKELKLKYRL